jgi:cathepsin C
MKKNLNKIVCMAAFVEADQPVHCLRSNVAGKWTIKVSTPFKPDIFNMEEICGHKIPNKTMVVQPSLKFDIGEIADTIKVQLHNDFTTDNGGNWSPIYDQGMFVETP